MNSALKWVLARLDVGQPHTAPVPGSDSPGQHGLRGDLLDAAGDEKGRLAHRAQGVLDAAGGEERRCLAVVRHTGREGNLHLPVVVVIGEVLAHLNVQIWVQWDQ